MSELRFVAMHPATEKVHSIYAETLNNPTILATCGRRLGPNFLIKQAHLADTSPDNPQRCKQCIWDKQL